MASAANIFLRTNKTATNKHGIDRVDKIPPDQVCVLYLGGNLTKSAYAASGNAKIIEQEILPGLSRTVPVYSVQYSFDGDVDIEFAREYTFHKYGRSFMYSPRLRAFISMNKKNLNTEFRRHILPRLHRNGTRNTRYALRNLGELYIAFDGNFDELSRQLGAKMDQEMHKIGYGDAVIKKAKEIMHGNSISASKLDFQYINDIFTNVMLPRISDNQGRTRLKLNDAVRRVRGLNIVAHCHGAYVALKIEEKTQLKMQELGYTSAEISKVLSQMLVVAHEPSIPMGVAKSRFISFMSANDSMLARPKNWITQYVMSRHADEADDKIDSDWLKPMFLSRKNGDVFVIHNAFTPDELGLPRDEEHNSAHYVGVQNQTKFGGLMALIAGNIIKNGIENSLANQTGRLKSLPRTCELILGGADAKWLKGVFAIMRQNGRHFLRDVYRYATENIEYMRGVRGIDKKMATSAENTRGVQ